MPVVNINGTWWCRYNLRGNVKNFEDQITLGNNPVGEEGITEYLKTCSDEDFVAIKNAAGDTPFIVAFTFGEYGVRDHGSNTTGGLMLSFTAFGK